MKHIKQITATALCAVLLVSVTIPAYAESASDEKQEVVYIRTDAAGQVHDIEVVNIMKGGEITDYGDYSAVKVLNTTDEIHQKGNKISISSDSDKVYYQGTMKEKCIPWDISIRYFLDGKEYAANEIAGKSGELEIHFSVSKNRNAAGSFYEDYALQASFTLDTEKCVDIVANGATVANVGSDKQISYTILPGKGIDAVISAKVTDFEMEAVSVNGIRLNLEVEIDEAELESKVKDLIDAVKQLDEGALALYGGSGELQKGVSRLQTGTSSLKEGSVALEEGITTLKNGMNTVQNSLNSLNAQSDDLATGSSDFKKALNTGAASLKKNLGYTQYKTLMKQKGLDIDELAAENAKAVETLKEYEVLLEQISQIPEYKELVDKYKPGLSRTAGEFTKLLSANNAALGGMKGYLDGFSDLTEGMGQLVTNYKKLDSGIGTYTGGVDKIAAGYSRLMSGITPLEEGSKELVSGSNQLYEGTEKLYDGVVSLQDGAADMTDGTGRFRTETTGMEEELEEKIDGILNSLGGNTKDSVSFVLPQNTKVDSVQFVIKTTGIEKTEAEQVKETQPEHLNFWEKLLELFGL